jgi:branched-chain amino acid transport system permease protein
MNMSKYSLGTVLVTTLGGGYALFAASPYVQSVIATILIYTIAVSGLNLLGGYAGYPNLTQATFMGVGAYAAAWTTKQLDWGFWPQILVTPLMAALLALVVALPLLRLRGQYFAIATLLLGVVLTTVVGNADVVGGSVGIGGFTRPVSDPRQWLLLLVVATAIVTLVMARLATWPIGRHLVALRRDESLSESIGIPVYRRKLQAFVIGSYVAGLAGVLLAYNSYYISPNLFGFYESFLLFVALIVGGAGTISGPLLGSIFLLGLPEVFRFAAEGRYLTLGVVFVLVMAFTPDGLAGIGGRTVRRLRDRSEAKPLTCSSTGTAAEKTVPPTPMKEVSHARR